LRIDNPRSNDLFNELKEIAVIKYPNIISVAFRSFIEFSVNFFLEKQGNKLAFNEKETLVCKIDKTLRILESMVEEPEKMKLALNWLYNSITTLEAAKATGNKAKSYDYNSIGQLNVLVHSHKYCPTSLELKTVYNNYQHYLDYLWAEYPAKKIDRPSTS